MGIPVFRFSLTHQTEENGPVQFTNGDFSVSISGWSNHCFSGSQSFTWTGGTAKADASASHHPNTCYFGQQKSGGWDQGNYIIDLTASNTSVTAGATLPYESLLSVYGSQDNLSFEPITYTGNASWTAGAGASTNRIAFTTTKSYNYLFFGWSKVGPTSNYYVILAVDEIEIISAPRYHRISEPDGWEDSKLVLERSKDYHSLVQFYEEEFIFYGNNGVDDGGIDFIKNVERNYGVDAEIILKAEISFDESTYEEVFTGKLFLYNLVELKDNKLQCAVIKESFWTTFFSRKETPVNLQAATDLNGNTVTPIDPTTINLTTQKIQKQAEFTGHTGYDTTLDNCEVATTASITLSGLPQTIDGVLVREGQRVLVKNQATQSQNGVYNATSGGAWTRTADANTGAELETAIVKILNGTTNAGTTWKQTTTPVTLGVSNIVFASYNYVSDYILFDSIDAISATDDIQFWTQASPDTTGLDEINRSFPYSFIGVNSIGSIFNVLEMQEDAGELTITADIDEELQLDVISTTGTMGNAQWTMNLYARVNDDTPVLIDTYSETQTIGATIGFLPVVDFNLSGTHTFTVKRSDSVYTYIEYNVVMTGTENLLTWRVYGGIIEGSTLNFKIQSVYPDSSAEGFLLHDAGAAIVQGMGIGNSFYSETLGSSLTTARQYNDNGCYWQNILVQGLQLRGYTLTEKQLSMSFNNWWKGADPLLNLGLTQDVIDGMPVIRVEQKSYFYDSSSTSVNLSNIRDITRQYDNEKIFNKIEIGFTKWQSEDISGIDDPQAKHTYATRLKGGGKSITIYSDFIAASIAIEVTRRQSIAASKDYKFDNDIFVIATNESGASPELDENFDSVTGLLNSETRYNIIHTPLRMLLRWANYVGIGLNNQYLNNSAFVFVKGEGNYDMVSDYNISLGNECLGKISDSLSEKQDIPLGPPSNYHTPLGIGLHFPQGFEFTIDMSWEEYKAIRDNPTLAIGVSQTDRNHVAMFINRLEYNICHSTAKFS